MKTAKAAKLLLFTAAFFATGAFAADTMMMEMKSMDANGDGMISKKEFMKHHEHMWSKLKKNKGGQVSVKDMEAMHAEMMKGGMHKEGMMKDKMEK